MKTKTLILMHAHNQWSRWNSALLQAAEDLGVDVHEDTYPNCSDDGSWDREWFVYKDQLDKAGGMEKLYNVAHEIHSKMMNG